MNSTQIDEDFLNALVDGDPRAIAIQESWKFSMPVTVMPADELQELADRCRTTFSFPRTDEPDLVEKYPDTIQALRLAGRLEDDPSRNCFYVYVYTREIADDYGDVGSPYYVGKGKNGRSTDPKHKVRVPTNPDHILHVLEGVPEAEAYYTEQVLIAEHGRIDLDSGCLENLTDGGNGGSASDFQLSEEDAALFKERTVRFSYESNLRNKRASYVK